MTPGQTFHDERSNEEDQEDVVGGRLGRRVGRLR